MFLKKASRGHLTWPMVKRYTFWDCIFNRENKVQTFCFGVHWLSDAFPANVLNIIRFPHTAYCISTYNTNFTEFSAGVLFGDSWTAGFNFGDFENARLLSPILSNSFRYLK